MMLLVKSPSRLSPDSILEQVQERFPSTPKLLDEISDLEETPLTETQRQTISFMLYYLIRICTSTTGNWDISFNRVQGVADIKQENQPDINRYISFTLHGSKKEQLRIHSAFVFQDTENLEGTGLGVSLYVQFFLEILKRGDIHQIGTRNLPAQTTAGKNIWRRLTELGLATPRISGLPFLGSVCDFSYITSKRANHILTLAKGLANTTRDNVFQHVH